MHEEKNRTETTFLECAFNYFPPFPLVDLIRRQGNERSFDDHIRKFPGGRHCRNGRKAEEAPPVPELRDLETQTGYSHLFPPKLSSSEDEGFPLRKDVNFALKELKPSGRRSFYICGDQSMCLSDSCSI